MKYLATKPILMMIIAFHVLMAQDFSGTYYMSSESGGITLTLQEQDQKVFRGELSDDENNFHVKATLQNGFLSGTIGEEGILFQAQLNDNYITVTMVETDDFGNQIQGTAQTLVFRRITQDETSASNQEHPTKGQIIINNAILSETQIAEIEKTYGIKPKSGNYWYDAKSGLYGVMGYPAFGFMLPGHDFGTLDRNASNGHTGVFVNKRELPQSEWAVWSYMIGYWIQRGSYWMDHNGNAGYEGNPIPLINLYAAAQQNAYSGQGGSGDNFWSSRFSAGNYDSGNQRGYVSVPGYGPVGYGF
jgi:hypothetical protein